MSLSKKVTKKMNEYGITIYKNYMVEGDAEHVFYIEDMILFANLEENSIGLSIQATTKPERAATLALIVNEIGVEVHIMEAFIYDENKQFIAGDKAYELIKSANHLKIKTEVEREEIYKQILASHACHEC